ncbi:hypothetical protein Cgig2_026919 [Carnegiea gigantea]|uniref:aminodeoxychorismate synthase n=1 Tax=Carnegiea gigantea TaxID=171969 RepID=A0A9Q1QSX1_9CARY|nr:hypothetical protein Cgig2_026919 [Carnegiea gigantea]
MGFSLCYSSLEAKNPYPEGFRSSKTKTPLPKASVRPVRKDEFQSFNVDTQKSLLVSSHVVPEALQEAAPSKQLWGETNPKVDYVRTLLIDNYDSYTFNIYQELSVINKVPPVVVRNDEWTWDEAYYYLYEERAFDNIVISPGPGSPMLMSPTAAEVQGYTNPGGVPWTSGIALGFAHGAQIVHASQPIHGRLSEIEHNGSRLFHHIPSGRNSGFKVVRYHSLVIDEYTLPKELVPIAWTCSSNTLSFLDTSCLIPDPYLGNGSSSFAVPGGKLQSDKVLMGIKHVTRPHYGLQFHPESVATSYGRQMFKNFRDITVDYWQRMSASSFNRNFNVDPGELNAYTTYSYSVDLSSKVYLAWMQVPHTVQPLGMLRSRLVPDDRNRMTHRFINNFLHTTSNTSIGGVQQLQLRWKKLYSFANKVGGSRNIFCELFGDLKGEETFWLDSSSIEKGRARFSFMGKKGGSLWKQLSFKLSNERSGGHLSIEDAQGNVRSMFLEDGFLDFLNKSDQSVLTATDNGVMLKFLRINASVSIQQELQSIHCDEEDYQGLPFDFCGGYVGYIGYNLKVECGAASNSHKSGAPDACLFFVDNFLAIDHYNGDVYVMSIHDKNTHATSWLDDMQLKLYRLEGSGTEVIEQYSLPALSSPFKAGFLSEKSRDQYIEDVEKCLEYIKDGQSYELCFTTQMRKDIKEVEPLTLYLGLREQNPAPYAAWLNFPKEDLCICCSSPERFLRLDKDSVLEAKPIKGTVSRGSTPEEDKQLKLHLQCSEKDQAENLMIVDLLRNDLGQVCDPGSVHVPHLMDVESYATVHTMVSTIRGKKREDVSPVDCVRAAFPGGSMTGAPKLRSMEILDSLESCSRGIYSGSIGYFSINGTFDLNIVIRTVVIHEGEASIGAGGAVVALSKPEDEYEEMILKARAPTRAILACQTESVSSTK